jgi:hypothetical protein
MILQASLDSWFSLASTVFAAVAAVATIVAVIYARKTVNESKAATKAVAEQHREQIAELKASAAASHAASQKDLLGRRIAFDHDLAIRRLEQLQRIADALTELIHAAREERTQPSARITDIQPGRAVSSTGIPALQRQLAIEVRILKQLGGPNLSEVIPPERRDDQQAGLQRLWFDGLAALEQIRGMIEMYEVFQPDAAWDRLHEPSPTRPMDMLGGP